MKPFLIYSLVALFFSLPGCKTTETQKEPASSVTVMNGAKLPYEFQPKSDKELRREERRRQKTSGFFYSR